MFPSISSRCVGMTLWAVLGLLFSAFTGCASRPEMKAPTSNLARDNALQLARSTAASIGGKVFTIAPTGSMKPTLDETSIVAVEPTAFDSLRRGDLVVYASSRGVPVLHRLYQRTTTGQWYVAGDNNALLDTESVSERNFIGRVCAIFYTSAPVSGTRAAYTLSPHAKLDSEATSID